MLLLVVCGNTSADFAAVATCPRGAPQVRFFEFRQCFWIFLLLSPPPFKFPNHSYVRQASKWWKYVLNVQCVFNNISLFICSFIHPRIFQNVYIINYSAIKLLSHLSWFQFLSRKDIILIEKYTFSIYGGWGVALKHFYRVWRNYSTSTPFKVGGDTTQLLQ